MSCLALNVYILGNNALPTHQHGLQEVSTHVTINAYKGTRGKVQLHIPILPFNPKVCFMLRAWEIQLSMQAWNAKQSTVLWRLFSNTLTQQFLSFFIVLMFLFVSVSLYKRIREHKYSVPFPRYFFQNYCFSQNKRCGLVGSIGICGVSLMKPLSNRLAALWKMFVLRIAADPSSSFLFFFSPENIFRGKCEIMTLLTMNDSFYLLLVSTSFFQ